MSSGKSVPGGGSVINKLNSLSQPQRERLRHIDFRLYFFGDVNRNDLVDHLGISDASASRDFKAYVGLAPHNLEYNTNAKRYIVRDSFQPLFDYSSSRVLHSLLHGIADDAEGGFSTPLACASLIQTYPDVGVIAAITRAIHQQKMLNVEYLSLPGDSNQAKIVPHTLVDNGQHWHVRAYNVSGKAFTDFNLNHFESAETLSDAPIPVEAKKEHDSQWQHRIKLEIKLKKVAHPKAIQKEYGFQGENLYFTVRSALAGYFLRRLNIDCTSNGRLDIDQYPLRLTGLKALIGCESAGLAPGFK